MPAEGGPARRLTYLGPDVMVRGWTNDGRILFVTTHGQPFFRNYRAYTIAVDGGLPQQLPLGQVNHLAFGPGNARVIGRNTADPARWKRYRGGTAGHLWIDAQGDGQFRRMTELSGNITCPMWIGERIWFLSDGEGVGNIYSCRPDGSDAAAPHRSRRLLRAPRTVGRRAHRLPVRRADLVPRPALRRDAPGGDRRARSSRPGGTAVRRRRRVPARVQRPSRGPQPRGRRPRQAVQFRPVGGSRAAVGHRRRSAPARPVAGGRPDVHRRLRRLGRGSAGGVSRRDRANAALGHRTHRGDGGRAARFAGRHRQSPQRGAGR